MFLKQFNGWAQENSDTQVLKCSNCFNNTPHFVYVAPYGPQLGFIFLSKPFVGMRKYFLACPTCQNLTREITKQQCQILIKR
jgi:hypothetical protein